MSIKLPFIDRIMMLSQGFINGKRHRHDRPRSYDVVVLPSPTQRGSQQSPLSSVPSIKPNSAVTALLVSGKADRLWLVGKGRGRDAEDTRSNLG